MKIFSLFSILFFTIVLSYSNIAQDIGAIKKISGYSIPEKISAPMGDPLPAGTYSIGSGGYFPSIDSAFNKLSIDGIAGEVTLELIDNLYTAPTETYGFLLTGPIVGAGENSRIIIKPAQNHQVTIQGDGGSVLHFSNTSYVTLDGVTLTGPTSLQINSFHNSQFTWNDGIDFLDDSDHNIVTTINFNSTDSTRPSAAIGFWTNSSGAIGAPDSNLIENNSIVQACLAIYVSAYNSNVYGFDNIVRNNLVSAPIGNAIRWGIQLEKNENTIVENNVVNNLMNSVSSLELALGINAYSSNSCIIRNNVVHSVSSNIRNGSTGILLSGIAGNEGYDNMIYNNMIFDIQSTSSNIYSRVTGIQTWQNHNPKVYYNSINLSGTGSNYMGSGALFIRTNTTNIEAYDNIFVNTRDESPYCASSINVWTNPTILTSDYNDLYYHPNQNNCLVRVAGSDYFNLEEWQTTGHDVQSISEMPNFLALDDLHIDESIPTNLESGATPITGIGTDFDGDVRHSTTPDIGADEFDGIGIDTLYVPGDYTTIQEAIDAAMDGNVVLVGDGTYYENINYKGKAITVASYYLRDTSEAHISNTIIDGSQPANQDNGSVVFFVSGEDSTSIIRGFTIKNGTGTQNGPDRRGGGILIISSSPTIKNNIIENNELQNNGDTWGSGIFALGPFNTTLTIESNIIRNNSAQTSSSADVCIGAINLSPFTSNEVMVVRNNSIYNNTISGDYYLFGGGIMCYGWNDPSIVLYLENNKIFSNVVTDSPGSSVQWGGGIYLEAINAFVRNNIIAYNTAEDGGGLYYFNAVNPPPVYPVLENNTFYGNIATVSSGAFNANHPYEIKNCIVWGNSSLQIVGGLATITYSNLEEPYSGDGNISVEPEFLDTTDYFLLSDMSPCIDMGNPDPSYNDIEDPNNLGFALYPAQGTLRNDIGHFGGPYSLWSDLIVSSIDRDESEDGIPSDFTLLQNYPNPFNPTTTIEYGISERTFVELKIFDILGREVVLLVKEEQDAGYYNVNFNASQLASGIYFYSLTAGSFSETKKMMLLK